MRVVETIAEMKKVRRKLKGTVGFWPTLGYLHEGHLTLVRRSVAENDSTIVSIFVNPTQFGPSEDFGRYPRDYPRDLSMLEKEKVDFVFMPSVDEMYPPHYNSWVELKDITDRLEGATRPGHFRGVDTVCNKLFNIVEPTRAYFGQKDAQQVLVLKKMVTELNMNLELVICPTVREPDGLAMSSRNTYLTAEQRKTAPVLYKSLMLAKDLYAKGERGAKKIHGRMTELIQKEPLAVIDYISIADPETLEELDVIKSQALVSMAVRVGKTRLIDNVALG